MELGSVEKLLSGSKFEDHAADIAALFDQLGIKTLDDLDNAPRKLGPRVAVYSTFQLCAYLRQAVFQAILDEPVDIEFIEPEPVPDLELEPEEAEIEVKESEQEIESDERSKE